MAKDKTNAYFFNFDGHAARDIQATIAESYLTRVPGSEISLSLSPLSFSLFCFRSIHHKMLMDNRANPWENESFLKFNA